MVNGGWRSVTAVAAHSKSLSFIIYHFSFLIFHLSSFIFHFSSLIFLSSARHLCRFYKGRWPTKRIFNFQSSIFKCLASVVPIGLSTIKEAFLSVKGIISSGVGDDFLDPWEASLSFDTTKVQHSPPPF